jgi:hypothetical protein
MISYVLAFFLGLGVSYGPLAFLSIPFKIFAEVLVSYGSILSNYFIVELARVPHTSKLSYYLVPLISITLPSFVALTMVILAKSVTSIKKTISLFGVLVSFSSFLFLKWSEALVLVVASFIIAFLLNFVVGGLLVIPLVTFGTSIAINITIDVFNEKNENINKAVKIFQSAQPGSDPLIWKYALAFAALAPLVGILAVIFNYGQPKSK